MTGEVLVYRLYEPGELDERTAVLGTLLTVPGPGRPLLSVFKVLPGGCFRWFDDGRMNRNPTPDRLPSGEQGARRAAFTYMRAVNQAADRYRQERALDRQRFPEPFPIATLRQGAACRVPSFRGGRRHGDDHWLTSWNQWLPAKATAAREPALVQGGVVEVRVGAEGQVIGVVSRVRPWRTVSSRPAFAWAAPHDHEHHDHGSGLVAGPRATPPLVYVLDGPDERLRYLSPSWLIAPDEGQPHSHATRTLWPACDHTLFPEIVVERHDENAVVRATLLTAGRAVIALQHGVTWRLRWSVASLREFIDGESRVVEATSVALQGHGLFQVALEVEHLPTGAVRSTHAQIPVLG